MRKPQNIHVMLILANAFVWSLNGLAYTHKLPLLARGGILATITANPSRVQIQIDGSPWLDGQFTQTPTQVRVGPGHHKFTVSRPGFVPATFSALLNPASGANPAPAPRFDATLEPTPGQRFSLEISSDDDEVNAQLVAIVDGGLESGVLPLNVEALVAGRHTIELRNDSGEILKKPFVCALEFDQTQEPTSTRVLVSRSNKKLRITGCKRPAQ